MLAADHAEYTETCALTELPEFDPMMEEELQVAVNGCFLNQALFSLHSEDMIHFSVENNKTTVNIVELLIGNDMKKDFEKEAQCKFNFYTNGTAPTLQIGKEWSILEAKLDL